MKKILKLKVKFLSVKFIFCVLFFCFVFSCNNSENKKKNNKPKRLVNKNILIILGKDYYMRNDILDYFKKDYLLGSADSKIQVYTYNEMLTKSGKIILRSIKDEIEESNCDIVIALGTPEGSSRYLMQARKKYPEKVFISLLPMEDTLPLEASCDIVVDFKLPDTLLNEEAAFTVSSEKIQLLLVAAVFAGEDIIAKNKNTNFSPYEEFYRAFFTAHSVLFPTAESITSFKVAPFVDPDTSIPSRKYLIVHEN